MIDLKTLRIARGLNQAELATKVKTSQPQINRLEAGERKMTPAWAERLAPHLGVRPVDLIYPDIANTPYTGAPLISWVSAGALAQADARLRIEDELIIYAPDLDLDGDWIALRVDGDSMNRISPHDSVIFVNRKDRRLVPNACYVIGDGEGGATYKRFRPPNRWEPVSTNPEHDAFDLPQGVEPDIIGRVRKTVLSL